MSRRRLLLKAFIVGLIGALAYLVVIRPRLWMARAEALMEADPCPREEGPPKDGFFLAVPLAYRASRYPGVSRDETDAAQARCVGTFFGECIRLRGEATQRSHDARVDSDPDYWNKWRLHVDPEEQKRFCASWKRFIRFLDEAHAKWRRVCAYCAPPGSEVTSPTRRRPPP